MSETICLEENKIRPAPLSKAAVICGLAALFYLYEFILQVSPNVMTHDLMRDLHIDAAGLGIISMFYYVAYTPVQIPAGLLFDKFGARIIITLAVGICSLGAVLFGVTNGMLLASCGRFLMGAGSAFAFIGALVLVARWFEPKYFALITGIVQLLSSIGAIMGETPLALASSFYGWRDTMIVIGIVGFVLMITFYLFVRDYPPGASKKASTLPSADGHILENLQIVTKSLQNWWVALYSFTNWAAVLTFAALWGTPYIAEYYQMSDTMAATAGIMVWLGIGVSSPFIGWWSDKIGKRVLPLTCASAIGVIASCVILYVPHVPLMVMYFALFMLGAAAGGQSLSFALVKDLNRPKTVGTVIGFNNMAVVCGGLIFQPLVGFLLRMNWDGVMFNGTPFYSVENFRSAFIILPLTYLVSTVVSHFLLQETNCKQLIMGD